VTSYCRANVLPFRPERFDVRSLANVVLKQTNHSLIHTYVIYNSCTLHHQLFNPQARTIETNVESILLAKITYLKPKRRWTRGEHVPATH